MAHTNWNLNSSPKPIVIQEKNGLNWSELKKLTQCHLVVIVIMEG